jgi:hypothetical protein
MVQAVSETAITDLLRSRHRIGECVEDDFTVRKFTAIAETQAGATQVMSYLLGAIAAVSLVVGGIGIRNIMRVSVTERTREIGTRMAIGAHRRDVLMQFMIEGLTLSFFELRAWPPAWGRGLMAGGPTARDTDDRQARVHAAGNGGGLFCRRVFWVLSCPARRVT